MFISSHSHLYIHAETPKGEARSSKRTSKYERKNEICFRKRNNDMNTFSFNYPFHLYLRYTKNIQKMDYLKCNMHLRGELHRPQNDLY